MINDDLLANQEKKSRRCLKCNAEFESEGPHNRICPRCKTQSAWKNNGSINQQPARLPARGKGTTPPSGFQLRQRRY